MDSAVNFLHEGQKYLQKAVSNILEGRYRTSSEFARKALDLMPSSAEACNALGYSLQQLGDPDGACGYYRRAVRLCPSFAEPLNHLGAALTEKENYEEAIDAFERALRLEPEYSEVYNNLAIAFRNIGDFSKAAANLRHVLEIEPDSAEAYYNLGNTLCEMGRCREAAECYDSAVRLKPDYPQARWNKSFAFFLDGKIAEGFRQYQWRKDGGLDLFIYPHRYNKPLWDGFPLKGKTILIHYEQGFGDVIQFLRYVPMVKDLGARVLLEVRAPVAALLKDFKCVDKVIEARLDSAVQEGFDCYVPLIDLPLIFGTTLETIPAEVPYMTADRSRSEEWSRRICTNGLNIGLVWGCKPKDNINRRRNCSLEGLRFLTDIEDINFYGLQKGGEEATEPDFENKYGFSNPGADFETFADTAAVIDNLDLVITVDTSVLHLAGAMGKPVWALIPATPGWRWMLKREDSPWYPTLRLFRQDKLGEWDPVVQRIKKGLLQWEHGNGAT